MKRCAHVVLLFALSASAQTIITPVLTHHFPHDAGMNDRNWGIGYERAIRPNLSLLVEDFDNSLRRNTLIAGVSYMPIHVRRASFGLAAGLDLTHGYNDNPAAPFIADARAIYQVNSRFGIGVDVMPGINSGVSLSLRYRLPKYFRLTVQHKTVR